MIGYDYKPCCRCGGWWWEMYVTWPAKESVCWHCLLHPDDGERVEPIKNLPKEYLHGTEQLGRILLTSSD